MPQPACIIHPDHGFTQYFYIRRLLLIYSVIMKKSLTLLLLSTAVFFGLNAQCVVDTNNFNLFYPPSADFPCVERTVPFDASIQFFVPAVYAGITVDSAFTTGINGLPAGITYDCNPPSCSIAGGEHGCMHFTGTTTLAVGTYTFTIVGYVKTSAGTFTLQDVDNGSGITQYDVRIIEPGSPCGEDTVASGISSTVLSGVSMKVSNTGNNNFNLAFVSAMPLNGTLKVVDLSGRQVYNQPISINGTNNYNLNLNGNAAGVYFVTFSCGSGKITHKLALAGN